MGGGVIANQPPTPFQEDAGTPSPHGLIDIAGSDAPYRRPTGPRTMGRELPPAAGESADVAGGWARETAGSGRVSGAMVHVSKRDMERDGGGGAIADRPPRRRVRKSTGPPLDAAERSADVSVVFLISYRGRLKRPHWH